MGIQFQSLFTIQLLHDYYNLHEKRCADFDIVPADDCLQQMKNLRMLHKNLGNKLLLVCSAEKELNSVPPPVFKLKPFISLPKGMVLRFYLQLKNPYFSNFTSLALPLAEKKKFYLSNLSQNKVGSTLSLSNTAASFNVDKRYAPGEIVKDSVGNLYEAVRLGDGSVGSKDIFNTNYWMPAAGNDPYVNSADMVILVNNNYTHKLIVPAGDITITIFSLDITDSNLRYTILTETVVQNFQQNQETVTVDLTKRKAGKYRIVINGEPDVWVYADPVAVKQNAFAILEIHHFEKVPADFKLLTADGYIKMPEPKFTGLFKNRSIFWKYISQSGGAMSITDESAIPQTFLPANAALVRSEKAIPLQEEPNKKIKAAVGGREIKKLKNPSVDKLVFETENSTGFFAANMYIQLT